MLAHVPTGSMAPQIGLRRRVVGNSLEDTSDFQLDTTRLEPELRCLKDFPIQITDWRDLEPSDVVELFRMGPPSDLRLLAIAIFAGTAQACMHGWYWSPYPSCPAAGQVDCGHLLRPCSRLHMLDAEPPPGSFTPVGDGEVRITCEPNCNPMDLGIAKMKKAGSRVAVVRYTSTCDPRNEPPTTARGAQPRFARYTHCREDAVFIRTSYWQAFERMNCDINAPVGECLDRGGLIYTPGVGILRGPVEEGAMWYQDPPREDIIWVAVPPRPQLAEQEQYAHEQDRDAMERVVDRIFLWAASNGVDVLVMPPLGCGAYGCQHPCLDVADIINRTAQRYAHLIPDVCIGSDWPAHFQPNDNNGNRWWDSFADAVQNGRPPIDQSPMTNIRPSMPKLHKADGKDFEALLEKNRKLAGMKGSTKRRTFL